MLEQIKWSIPKAAKEAQENRPFAAKGIITLDEHGTVCLGHVRYGIGDILDALWLNASDTEIKNAFL